MSNPKYVLALSWRALTPMYDALVEGPMSALRLRKVLLDQLCDVDNKRILDVGCGTGTLATMLKRRFPSADVVALDGDPEILDIACSKAKEFGVPIQFQQGMSFDLPFPDGSFDGVLSSLMLHHLVREDKQKTAAEVYRVMRSGGRLLVLDFAESRGLLGIALNSLVRRFERIADNLDGFLPVIFSEAGFHGGREIRRFLFGSLAVLEFSK